MRGQVALEFLMTYGYALLALLLLVGAVMYFGVLQATFVPAQCTMTQPFSCLEYKALSDGTVLLGIVNNGDEIASADLTLYCSPDDATGVSYSQTTPVGRRGRLNGSLVRLGCPPSTDAFRGSLAMTYRVRGETVVHETGGTVRLPVED